MRTPAHAELIGAHKRYLRVDLGARYADVTSLRDGIEIQQLHG